MSRNIVTRGLGGPLLITEGYGRSGAVVPVTDGPGEIILDHATRTLSQFVTQFRRTRDLSLDPVVLATAAPDHTPVDLTPSASSPILTHVADAKVLFITQFRRIRG
jgi:hypothetical protein